MATTYLKRSQPAAATDDEAIARRVGEMLERIRAEGERAVTGYAQQLDGFDGDFILAAEERQRLIALVPEDVRDDIIFAWRQIRHFAEAQRASLTEFEIETQPGVTLGQRIVPVRVAGCYVPGGRYAHAASALMSVATAKVAGVPTVVACSPPRNGAIHPAVVFAMDLAGADVILQMGGVHAVATMALGLFGIPPADLLVGPGNAYVAAAKRQLFGEVGIDVIAGPTESAIIADAGADPHTIAVDLASQAEHGPDSPVWLITSSREVADRVMALLPVVAAAMPSHETVITAWSRHGEVILCDSREEMVRASDAYAPEHLQIMADDHRWWLAHLSNYGSLFLGEGSTVTHGDKCSGTNHILPTRGAARYTGGLNVQKFLKVLTWQKLDEAANLSYSAVGSRISRVEGMEGHARACDWRLRRYFPHQDWPFEVHGFDELSPGTDEPA
ncbi:MAG: histidinol dehydrogenase [Pseudomonadales bacterium]|nr:histidinol dehydrogenase [Pseudomonadales bacterium]NIX09661.1 histidinol dehydrogenase [Pseudomonadales bacterium]